MGLEWHDDNTVEVVLVENIRRLVLLLARSEVVVAEYDALSCKSDDMLF